MATTSTASAETGKALTGERSEAWASWEWGAVAVVVLVALGLRLHGMTQAPRLTDNADELYFAWYGLNLILHGDAYTWSYLPGYPSTTILHAYGTTFPLVHHSMDHPPLFGLIIGGWCWLTGARDMLQVTATQVRTLPVVFGTLSVLLVHALGRRLLGPGPALLGATLLATAPGAVLVSRQAEPESLQALLLLAALLLTMRAVDGKAGPWSLVGLLACCLAAPLLKVPGVAVAGICAPILAASRRWWWAGATLGAAAAGLLLFALYGWLVDWSLFVRIWSDQAATRSGMLSGFDFIAAAAGINRSLHDGWWLLGWIGLGVLAARGEQRRELFLVWPPVAYAAVMLVLAAELRVEQYAWYRLIVYPSVGLGAGWLAWEAVRRSSLPLLTLLMVLGGAASTNWWLGGAGATWVPNPFLLAALMAAVLVPAALCARPTGWAGKGDLGVGRGERLAPTSSTLRRWALGAGVAAVGFMLIGNTVESLLLPVIFTHM
jgi:4-amino-4-deoxy-L-arabinose transferase-like glycosyltransferase